MTTLALSLITPMNILKMTPLNFLPPSRKEEEEEEREVVEGEEEKEAGSVSC